MSYRQPRKINERSEYGVGRMLLVSLGVHLLVVALFSGVILPRAHRDLRPVYHVDLLNLPVRDPQAGRPDGRPPAPAEAKPPPKPPEPKPAPVQAVPRSEPAKPAPKAPSPAAKAPAPAPTKPATPAPKVEAPKAPPAASARELEKTLEQMRRRQELEAARQRIAELAKQDTRQAVPPVEAPLGIPEGKGKEAGVDEMTWIGDFIKANWALSEYQVGGRLDLLAKVHLQYGATGALVNYRFLKPSGDLNFDESVKRAILKEKQLPFDPQRPLEIEVEFNLKDLMPR